MRSILKASLCALVASILGAAAPVMAQEWPSKPIRIIVPFPPANGADVTARNLSNQLSQRLGQPVVIENRGGAGGLIGMEVVAAAAPDGYTVAIASLSPITILPAVKKKMPYDASKSFVGITLLSYGPNVLLVNKDLPVNNVKELIAYSKANPDKLAYGSLGRGTISQLVTEMFKGATGAQLREVNYKGSAQLLTDMMGGHVHVVFDGAASASLQVKTGKVKALGVTTLTRSSVMPEVPTLNEQGIASLKGFETIGWMGAFVPMGTPQSIVLRLQKELSEIVATEEFRKAMSVAALDVPAKPLSVEQFDQFVKKDYARWSKVARDLKIELE
jgi:tripartite-type tricarboxylate transporter receptor subunit TctC